MPDEDIVINVREESSGNAIQAKLEEIERLNKAADAYEEKYGADDTTTKSARAEAAKVQRDVDKHNADRLRAEEKIRREKEKQQAIVRSTISHAASQAGFGSVSGDIADLVMGKLGVAAGAGLASYGANKIIEAVTESLNNAATAQLQTTLVGRNFAVENLHFNRSAQQALGASQRTSVIESAEDSIQGLNSQRDQNRHQIEALRRGKVASVASWAATGAGTGAAVGSVVPVVGTGIGAGVGALLGAGAAMVNNHFGADVQIDELDTQQRMTDAQKQQRRAEIERQEKERAFDREREIRVQEAQNRGDMKSVRILQDDLAWHRRYNELIRQKASVEEAERGANATLAGIQKDRAGEVARLANSRSGAADIARIAALAREQRGNNVAEITEKMRTDINRHAREVNNAAWHAQFQKKPLK